MQRRPLGFVCGGEDKSVYILCLRFLEEKKKERDIVCQDISHIMYEFNVNRNIFKDISAMLNLTV